VAGARYRKQPDVGVTAEQWFPGRSVPGVAYELEYPDVGPDGKRPTQRQRPYVVTVHEQKVYLSPGDWVCPERDGEHFSPVADGVFKATYEPIEGEEGASR
jgi:hypothetical protein